MQEDSIHVPVLVDAVRQIRDVGVVRCTYFAIECDSPTPGWTMGLDTQRIPFLMLGLSGIIYQPSVDRPEFTSPADIELLFSTIEDHESLDVVTGTVLIPEAAIRRQNKSVERGMVFRLGYDLFRRLARADRDGAGPLELCEQMANVTERDLFFSPGETEVFREWELQLVKEAKAQHKKQRDYEQYHLEWEGEDGNDEPPTSPSSNDGPEQPSAMDDGTDRFRFLDLKDHRHEGGSEAEESGEESADLDNEKGITE